MTLLSFIVYIHYNIYCLKNNEFGMSGQNLRMNGHFVVFYPLSTDNWTLCNIPFDPDKKQTRRNTIPIPPSGLLQYYHAAAF